MMDLIPIYITLKLGVLTTLILLLIAIPLAYFFAFSKWRIKVLFESLIMLPIVLPPTVLGFYYLSFLGPNSVIGMFFQDYFGFSFAFSFEGILFGSIVYCLPFMITPITEGFRAIPKNLLYAADTMGKSKISILTKVMLPYIKQFLLNGIMLTFAHTLGEFGLILMIGGKMEDTRVASVEIYDQMNMLNFELAGDYALVLLLISFLLIFIINLTRKKSGQLHHN
ncbi:MAG: molybdate ABC transporter permease subunit [Flavobacteriales bacterium]|nr:molybdate ABC transporter permease subunit [Flavobacteriales bacterium]